MVQVGRLASFPRQLCQVAPLKNTNAQRQTPLHLAGRIEHQRHGEGRRREWGGGVGCGGREARVSGVALCFGQVCLPVGVGFLILCHAISNYLIKNDKRHNQKSSKGQTISVCHEKERYVNEVQGESVGRFGRVWHLQTGDKEHLLLKYIF